MSQIEEVASGVVRREPTSAAAVLMDAHKAAELASQYGIPVPAQRECGSAEEACRAADELGYPVVLKALGKEIVHKSDVGGVALNVRDRRSVGEQARKVLEEVPGTEQILVQRMEPAGTVEMIVGARRDPIFGPVVMLGLGGLWTEAFDDIAVRLAPVAGGSVAQMIEDLRSRAVLRGARGVPGINLEGIGAVVASVSRLIADESTVAEIDLNPVICDADRVVAVDIRILQQPDPGVPAEHSPRSPQQLDALLAPRSVVVVGASRNPAKQGGRLLRYLIRHEFQGEIVVVNPHATEVMGCRAVPSVDKIEFVPDLACICVPAETAIDVLEECGRAGVKAAIIFGAGFSEVGGFEAQMRQQQLTKVARSYGMVVCGPNTAGLASRPVGLCASMGASFEMGDGPLPHGSVAVVSQSGAIGGSLLSRLRESEIGFSHWISTGNESDLTIGDYLGWLARDPETATILLFVEAIRDAEAFRAGCEAARANGKAVIAYKTGRSEVGRAAVQSHTAALAGDERVYDAFFKELGVIEVENLQQLIDAAIVLEWQPAPIGARVGVVSASGGACSVVADECARRGLELPRLSTAARTAIEAAIPSFGHAENPVDVTMQINVEPGMIGIATEAMLQDDGIDAVLVMLTSNADPPAIEVARGVVRAAQGSHKPVVVARMGAEVLAPGSLRLYREARVPVFSMPERAIAAMAAVASVGLRSLRADETDTSTTSAQEEAR
ncbi:acetate--CoA ligase family protein [Nocardioides cheoyonin]|uniref:acetate--CoA ligase family protein n=1 Tax=Nocardioides cheoyonin TaxID=3156615 RepID=UPI0032B59F8B